jgi:hypothetical protein
MYRRHILRIIFRSINKELAANLAKQRFAVQDIATPAASIEKHRLTFPDIAAPAASLVKPHFVFRVSQRMLRGLRSSASLSSIIKGD